MVNNHGSWFDVTWQAVAAFAGSMSSATTAAAEVNTRRIATQVTPNGTQWIEVERTNSVGYCVYNLVALTRAADIAASLGVDVWSYVAPHGGSLRKALDFMIPYVKGEKWQYPQIEPPQYGELVEPFRRASRAYRNRTYEQLACELQQADWQRWRGANATDTSHLDLLIPPVFELTRPRTWSPATQCKTDDAHSSVQLGNIELATVAVAATPCPCGDAQLCKPLAQRKTAPAHREVLGLCHWCNAEQLDWDALTILTSGGFDARYWPSDEMLCAAHAHGVPFLINHVMLSDEESGPSPSTSSTIWNALSPNETARAQWIDHAVRMLSHFPNGTARRVAVDGISFDYEGYSTGGVNANGTFGGDSAAWYVPLMAETKRAMRSSGMPLPIINWDVSTKAAVYEGWNMSATDLAEIDTFFIMSIDGSDGFEELRPPWAIPHHKPGFAHGLAPPQGLEWAIKSDKGVGSILPTERLFLGIAWYEVRWACAGQGPFDGPCPLANYHNGQPVKVNHSNNHVTDYNQVAQSLLGNASFHPRYENTTATYFVDITCPDDGPHACSSNGGGFPGLCVCYGWEGPSGPAQIFYDNPQTLRAKYELAVSLGVGGVGPYFLNCLARPRELDNVSWAQNMWAALRDFANPDPK